MPAKELPPYHNPGFHVDPAQSMLGRHSEVPDIMADLARFGAMALASEIGPHQADKPSPPLPDPLTSKDFKKRVLVDFSGDAGSMFSRGVFDWAQEARTAHEEVESNLNLLRTANSASDVRDYLASRARSVASEQAGFWQKSGNTEMIIADADLPAFIKMGIQKDGWQTWIRTASTEQIVNFSQWYSLRLETLANRERKEKFTAELIQDYEKKIGRAMEEGWIDKRHQSQLKKTMRRQHVTYFSPFGQVASMHFGGARQKVELSRRDSIFLPTTVSPGSHISTHELGHSFAGVNTKAVIKKLIRVVGKKTVQEHLGIAAGCGELITILNEGFNDHMAFALREGDPTIISPSKRMEAGIERDPATSESYEVFREALSLLLIGDNQTELGIDDIRQVVDTMVTGDFEAFCKFVARRWSGRDVVGEILQQISTEFKDDETNYSVFSSEDTNRVLRIMKRALGMSVAVEDEAALTSRV